VERDRDMLGQGRNLLAVLAATVTRAQSRAPVEVAAHCGI